MHDGAKWGEQASPKIHTHLYLLGRRHCQLAIRLISNQDCSTQLLNGLLV